MHTAGAQLREFLLSGTLGPLRLNTTPAIAQTLLGEPEALQEQEHNAAMPPFVLQIYEYDNLVLTFEQRKPPGDEQPSLWMIAIYYWTNYPQQHQADIRDILPKLGLIWYPWLRGMAYPDFKRYLEQQQIAAQRVKFNIEWEPDDRSELVEINASGVQVGFNGDGIVDNVLASRGPRGNYTYQPL